MQTPPVVELQVIALTAGDVDWSDRQIADYMVNSDVLCTPSIWAENSPGVVIQALELGLPPDPWRPI